MIGKNPLKKISFHYLVDPFYFPRRISLKRFLLQLFAWEKKKVNSLAYVFCTDEFLLTKNQDFLQHDYYTDILTFNLSEYNTEITGEIYISVDRVRENALQYQVPFKNELIRVVFHGALHLCGYKDKTPKEMADMRKMEDYYIDKYK